MIAKAMICIVILVSYHQDPQVSMVHVEGGRAACDAVGDAALRLARAMRYDGNYTCAPASGPEATTIPAKPR